MHMRCVARLHAKHTDGPATETTHAIIYIYMCIYIYIYMFAALSEAMTSEGLSRRSHELMAVGKDEKKKKKKKKEKKKEKKKTKKKKKKENTSLGGRQQARQ